ncbi:protein Njmu-R1-like [Orbicella faveolata]|uniref:protein Njmu-R1-like n=1 Tax=Orbicella faveolata TaxID=48498 RepID=UPI0009E5747C|nr:protein Njmu-R1-like [Orbicella faveolata]
MADEPNTEENNEPKRDDFYGFALYTFKARRPNNAEVDRNENGEDDEDGGVASKAAVAAEGSVADFLRKEATSNNDFSLSLLSTNLSGVQETELRTFMAKRLTRGTVYSGSGNINTLENFFPDESALCYYCLLRGGKENGEEYRDQQEMDSIEFGSYLSKDYVVCLVSGSKSGLELFQKELDEYSNGLLPYIDKYTESQDVQESFKHLEAWYDENVKFVCRCTSLLKEDLSVLIGLGLLGGKLEVQGDERLKKDMKMFVDACSTVHVLGKSAESDASKDTENLESECTSVIPTEVIFKKDGSEYTLSSKVSTRFCREWAKTMLSDAVDNPVFLRQVIENYKLRVNHDLNTLKRLLRQAETDHYSLYRSYVFLLKCGNGPILLRNTTLEARALCSVDTLNVIRVLEEYIEENDKFGIEALSE